MMQDGERARSALCPICKKRTAWRENPCRPFCSERCRMIDLGKWAAEQYRIPGEKKDAGAEEEDAKKPHDGWKKNKK